MTAGQSAKAFGFSSLRELSLLSGVSEGTLRNWHKDKPITFKTIMYGAWILKAGA